MTPNPYAPHHAGPYATATAVAEPEEAFDPTAAPPWLDDIPEDERDRFQFRAEAALGFVTDLEPEGDPEATAWATGILSRIYVDRETFEAFVDDVLEAADDLADISVTGDGVVVVSVRDDDGELIEVRVARAMAAAVEVFVADPNSDPVAWYRADPTEQSPEGTEPVPADEALAAIADGAHVWLDDGVYRWDGDEYLWLRFEAGDGEDLLDGWVPVDGDVSAELGLPAVTQPEGDGLVIDGPVAFVGPDGETVAAESVVHPGTDAGEEEDRPATDEEMAESMVDEVPSAAGKVLDWLADPPEDPDGDDIDRATLRRRALAARIVEETRKPSDRRSTVEARIAELLG